MKLRRDNIRFDFWRLGPKGVALLRANLHHAPRLLLHLTDFLSFVDRQRHWLFAIHILAGLHGLDQNFAVPMVRRGDRHHVDIFAI